MKIALTLICLLTLCNICIAQEANIKCKGCDVSNIAIDRNLSLINEKKLYCFIKRFEVCKNSIEYQEYANPLLFEIILHNSPALVSLLIKYPALNKKYIHDAIKQPLLDYDLKRMIAVVDSANKNSKVKQQILSDLRMIKLDEYGYPR